jgi:hypothetical protein
MKNTISDQASVNKKFATLLQLWRAKAVPHVTEGWNLLSAEQQGKLVSMNNFWCGLHFLVGLSEQANKTLAVWENLVHNGAEVGAPSLPRGYAKAGEAGTTRLVRTTCKAVQERGCEKSGKPLMFRDYLQQEGQVKNVPLAPFKGNRFNILFHNSAGLFYLLQDISIFADRHHKDNLLFASLNADLRVTTFQAGARALGLVSKLVTGPLWRELEKDGHVSEMSAKFAELHESFQVHVFIAQIKVHTCYIRLCIKMTMGQGR